MFKKLFTRAAAKASLTNMKFDLDRLLSSFPHNIPEASKGIFSLIENGTLALCNNASEAEISEVIASKSASASDPLKEILSQLFRLVVASRRGDGATVNKCDARINEVFRTVTGGPIDVTQVSSFGSLGAFPRSP